MTEYFYRYRPISAVLDGFHELENQEIYFSTTDELNDPMEGFKDLVWSGDRVAWRNLLKHCILCVLQTANYCFIAGDRFDPNILRNIVFWLPQELPDAPIREIYQRVFTDFLAEPAVAKLVDVMAARSTPIRRSELTSNLRSLACIRDAGAHEGISRTWPLAVSRAGRQSAVAGRSAAQRHCDDGGYYKDHLVRHPVDRISEALFAANEATVAQVALVNEYLLPDRDKQLPIVFLTSRFPAAYVAALDKLVHRDWYVACFAKTALNHSTWSSYANGHRGVCLMFKATASATGAAPTLAVQQTTSASFSTGGPVVYSSSEVAHELKPVRYAVQYPTIDFFRSLGSVSENPVRSS